MVTDMLQESTKKALSEMKEVKVFKELMPNVYDYYKDSELLMDEWFYLDIDTFLYNNLLNVDVTVFTKHVKELAEKYDVEDTAIDNEEILIYPTYLMKYVYIHMKEFERNDKMTKLLNLVPTK